MFLNHVADYFYFVVKSSVFQDWPDFSMFRALARMSSWQPSDQWVIWLINSDIVTFPFLPPHQSACTGRDKNKAYWGWCRLACEQSSGQSSGLLHPVVLRGTHPASQDIKTVKQILHSCCLIKMHKVWNTIYLSCCPSPQYFPHTTDLAEPFQPLRLNYSGIDVQIVTHWVMATWE